MSKKYRCGNCGSFEVDSLETKGPFLWKDYQAVHLVKPISLLTCKKCGENILRHADVDKLDQAIEQSLTQLTQTLITGILQREGCTQEELASRLGITPPPPSRFFAKSRTTARALKPGWTAVPSG